MYIATYCHVYRHIGFDANFGIQFGVPNITHENIINDNPYFDRHEI